MKRCGVTAGWAALVLVLAGCHSTKVVQTGLTCGPGTVSQDGACVPEATAACGTGTMLVDGTCQAACPPGTMLQNGQCTLTSAVCGPGTQLVNGQCLVVDPLSQVTVPEGPEPNNTIATATKFMLPAVGADPVVLGGTIQAVQGGQADFDWFAFQGTALQRVHIEATAVGAPNIGVILTPASAPPAGAAPIQRFVFSLNARSSTRDLVLPVSGQWVLQVSDLDNLGLTSGTLSGGSTYTYVVKVSQVATEAAQMLAPNEPATGSLSSSALYDLMPDSQSVPIVNLTLSAPHGTAAFNGLRTVWATDSTGKLLFSNADTVAADGTIHRMSPQEVLIPSGGVQVGVDYVYALNQPGSYQLSAVPLPSTQVTTLTQSTPYADMGQLSNASQQTHVYALQIPANGVIDAQVTADSATDLQPQLQLRDASFQVVATAPVGTGTAELWAYVPQGKEGLYFLAVSNAKASGPGADLEYGLSIRALQASAGDPLDVPGNAYLSAPMGASETAFALPFTSSGIARLIVTPPASTAISAKLFTSTGQVLRASDPTMTMAGQGVEFDNVLVRQPGSLILVVSNQGGSGLLRLEVDAGPVRIVSKQGQNSSMMMAQNVTIDFSEPTVIEGSFDQFYGTDYYAFNFSGGTLNIDSEPGMHGPLASQEIDILDVNGDNFGSQNSYTGTLQMTSSQLQPGKYFLEIQSDPSAGDYELIVQATP